MRDSSTTLVASLTPPGQGAIATLGLIGPAAWDTLRSLFRPRAQQALPAMPRPGQFWLGRCGVDVADEVVLAVKHTSFEIHGHGGRAIVRLLLDLFTTHGIHSCSWQEFLRLTSADAIRAEAAVALTQAITTRTAALLLDQYNGACTHAVSEAVAALDRGELLPARVIVDELARWAKLGRRLTTPWRVAVVGAPNVGKSSLVNALAGYQRSVVAPTPGTTRDVVTTRIALDGWPIELADTAGLRTEAEALEGQGIERARRTAVEADLCLWVLDAAAPPAWPVADTTNVRMIVNKVDLPAAWDRARAGDALLVSATTGQGLAALCAALARWLVPEAPLAGSALPFTPRLCDAVEEARNSLTAGEVEVTRRVLGSMSLVKHSLHVCDSARGAS